MGAGQSEARSRRHQWLRTARVVALALLFSPSVRAQTAPPDLQPITSRDYAIDLYEGVVFGSPRLVAMGGAAFAVGEGASGLFTNPAAAAVRSSTQSDGLDFSMFLNSYIPTSGTDFNNNGNSTTELRRSAVYAPGVLVQFGRWGVGANLGYTRYEIAPQAGGGLGVRSLTPHLFVARRWWDNRVAIGVGLRGALLNVYTSETTQGLFTQSGVSGELGAVFQPHAANLRVAIAGALPVYAGAIQTSCDPNNCNGYILPREAISPWVAVLATGWRFSGSRWNEPVKTRYRDERHLTLALDLLVAGALSNAYGIEEFASKQLQPSGRNLSWSPRFGMDSEVLPGWIRLRVGTYWEPARYATVQGRAHITAGGQFRLWAFHLGKSEYRLAISIAGDFASRYQNAGASIGLWN